MTDDEIDRASRLSLMFCLGLILGVSMMYYSTIQTEVEINYIKDKINTAETLCKEHKGVKEFRVWGEGLVCNDGIEIIKYK